MSETAKPASASWPKYALPFDTTINGYRIERVLGSGGFGVTYLARDLLGQPFAIKEYFPRQFSVREDLTVVAASSEDASLFEECRDRFLREAQALVLLGRRARAEDGIVRVQTYFEAHGTCFMVMDFIEGMSLASVLQTAPGGLAAERVDELLRQLLTSLRTVHQAGLMHRDIKPANIILTDAGRAVLIDFGSSRESTTDLNTAYTQIYSGGYAPPEQMLGLPQGEFSDIYAVGAVCYQAVGGKVLDALLRQNTASAGRPDPLPPAAKIGAGRYPEKLLAAIDAALAIDPAGRPRNVDAMLAMFRSDESYDEPTIVRPPASVAPVPAQPRSRRGIVLAAAAALVVAGAGSAILWNQEARHSGESAVAAASAPGPETPPADKPQATVTVADAWDPSTSSPPPSTAKPDAASPVPLPSSAERTPERTSDTPPSAPGHAALEARLDSVPVLERAREAAEALPCSALTVRRESGGPRISGYASPGGELDQLLVRLRDMGNPADGITRVDPSNCAAITTVAALARQSWNSVPRTFSLRPEQREVADGARLRFNIDSVLPALIVDIYQEDGSVHHLAHPVRGGATNRFHAEWLAAGATGTRLIVAIASEKPIDLGTRPSSERADDYLETLRSRLDAATMELTADVTTVTVHHGTER